jgi:Homing endonuclease associated repeat
MEFIIEKTPDIEKELLLQDIRQSARKVAKITLSVKEYAKNGNFDPINPILYFGSWKAALEQAGLRTSPHNFVPSSALMENIKSVWIKL